MLFRMGLRTLIGGPHALRVVTDYHIIIKVCLPSSSRGPGINIPLQNIKNEGLIECLIFLY